MFYSGISSSSISVPVFSCTGCGGFEMPATACHCFPSSPEQPVYWISLDVLSLYSHLYAYSGASSSAFTQSLAELHQKTRLLAGDTLPGPVIESDQFSEVWVKYLEMTSRAASDQQELGPEADPEAEYSPGLCCNCPVCAELPSSALDLSDREAVLRCCRAKLEAATEFTLEEVAGATRQNLHLSRQTAQPNDRQESRSKDSNHRPFCVVLDGNQKMSHYRKCGAMWDAVLDLVRASNPESKPRHTHFGSLETAMPAWVWLKLSGLTLFRVPGIWIVDRTNMH